MFEWTIYLNISYAIISILVTVNLILIIVIKKGRHPKKTVNSVFSSNSSSNTTNVNLVNTVHCDKRPQSNQNNNGYGYKNIIEIKIPLLTENSNLQNWLALLEFNLKNVEKQEWIAIAIAFIDEKIISKLTDLNSLLNGEDGFELLKIELNKLLSKQDVKISKTENSNDFKSFFARNQLANESLENFALNIKSLITKIFQKSGRLNQELSFDQIVNYAIDKLNGFDTNLETESDGYNKTVRFKQTMPPIVKNSEQDRHSNNYIN
ncbi:unnamed protein product [Brachionus calyciflorus]|uniref:Uncharacterized protein n=1 Tax=Brachionus calyciflorus TaxID=104777 RepID=A0A814IW34_9BILA|nr:unnamed protein product [Brachionus calyciflorus]